MVRIIEKIHARRVENRHRRLHRDDHTHSQMSTSQQQQKEDGSDHSIDDKNPNWYYSLEFFPPKTEAGLDNLFTRIDRMVRRLEPLFIDVTWTHLSAASALALASHAQKYLGVDVLLHLSAVNLSRQRIAQILEQARQSGIQNILALRGDPPKGLAWTVGDVSGGDCDRAIDLVRLIRELHGDYFGIAVAGHPEGHPSSDNAQQEMEHLKDKIDAGADFIVTQFFYDTDKCLDFVRRCRNAGIAVPILPGIMPIQSYSSFERMTSYCRIAVPDKIWQQLDQVKDDDEAVKELGCTIAVDMCRRLLHDPSTDIDGLHFYTLNLERSVTRTLMDLGLINVIAASPDDDVDPTSSHADTVRSKAGRVLPWRPSAVEKRSKNELVRPINWANRPYSYVRRTEDWDEFPNGRWGDATSPAFGELSDIGHFYAFSLGSEDDQRAMLGHTPTREQDVYEVFAAYVEGKIPHIPWCETALQPESFLIQSQLAQLNRAGCLTINSQPAVNGVPSSHKTFGWGGTGGYIYQKAYCECFCSPAITKKLVALVQQHKSLNLYAVNYSGDEILAGVEPGGVTALTWGVFPNREIVQPTIFDPCAFTKGWSEEAFSLWTTLWLKLYDFDSPSYELLENIRDTYYLCAIIDNDFTGQRNKTIWDDLLEAL